MPEVTGDIIRPSTLVLPSITTTVRDTLIAEIGTLIWNTTTEKVNINTAKAAAATSWEELTSVEES